jgi:hypothetical protein
MFGNHLDEVAKLLLKNAAEEAPKKTGKLAKSLKIEKSNLRHAIVETVNYGVFVRKGTKPHPIFPVKKKALFWPGAAHPVAMVNHPGTKANPYAVRAVQKSRGDIGRINRQFGKAVEIEYG